MFKICAKCGQQWEDRESFLSDDSLEIIGYQMHFETLTLGLLLFNHSCQGTLSMSVETFRDLYDGPVFKTRKYGTEDCPGYCLNTETLDECPAPCECAYVRKIMQIIQRWEKNSR